MRLLDLFNKDVVILVEGEHLLTYMHDKTAGELTLMWGENEEQLTIPDTASIVSASKGEFALEGDEMPTFEVYKVVKELSEL